MSIRVLIVFIFLLISPQLSSADKVPVIILTDIGGDTDDEQSLVRLLLYTNQLDVKAICATSLMQHGNVIKPELIQKQIDAFNTVLPRLRVHDANYQYLSPKDIVKSGLPDSKKIGAGFDSEASDFIVKIVSKSNQSIWICVWGGQRELAQALWKISNTFNTLDAERIISNLRVFAIGDQDGHRDWILDNYRNLFYIASGFVNQGNAKVREISAYRGMYMTGNTGMQDSVWIKSFIRVRENPLGMLYPVNGHGVNGMKEGDSPSFLALIPNGLNDPEHPDWGGWGGRYRLLRNKLYIDALDFLDTTYNERHTVARWRPVFQADFVARIGWCYKKYPETNHPPQININGDSSFSVIKMYARPGSKVKLNASLTSDPENQSLYFNWWYYREASTCDSDVLLKGITKPVCVVSVPSDAVGRNIHIVLQVTDRADIPLTSCRRVVIMVR